MIPNFYRDVAFLIVLGGTITLVVHGHLAAAAVFVLTFLASYAFWKRRWERADARQEASR